MARQTAMLVSARYEAMSTMLRTDALTEYRRANIEWQEFPSEGLPKNIADPSRAAGAKWFEQRDNEKLRGSVDFGDGRTIISLFEHIFAVGQG